MGRSFSYLRRGLLGAALAGSLGFGVSQALAVPAEASVRDACKPELIEYCNQLCPPPGGECWLTPTGPVCACY